MLMNFYSGIYRTMINPQDYTGENPLWNSTQPYFDSFYWYATNPPRPGVCFPLLRNIVYGTRSDPSSHS